MKKASTGYFRLSLLFLLIVVSLVSHWGTYQLTAEDIVRPVDVGVFHHSPDKPSLVAIYAIGMKVDVTGLTGQAVLGMIRIKYWSVHIFVCLALILSSIQPRFLMLSVISFALGTVCLTLTGVFVADLFLRGGTKAFGGGWVALSLAMFEIVRVAVLNISSQVVIANNRHITTVSKIGQS